MIYTRALCYKAFTFIVLCSLITLGLLRSEKTTNEPNTSSLIPPSLFHFLLLVLYTRPKSRVRGYPVVPLSKVNGEVPVSHYQHPWVPTGRVPVSPTRQSARRESRESASSRVEDKGRRIGETPSSFLVM